MKQRNANFLRKEIILYLIFGILTTAVNYATFALAFKWLGQNSHLVANVISFIFATIFAYVTNKCFVFESRSWEFVILIKEVSSFFGARISTFAFEEAGLFLFVDILGAHQIRWFGINGTMIAKIVLSLLAVIANYVLSKKIIFKKSRNQN